MPSTVKLKHFKLMKVAGVDCARRPPQRDSCNASTARPGRRRTSCSKTCRLLEEAEKRDHPQAGRDWNWSSTWTDMPRARCWASEGGTGWAGGRSSTCARCTVRTATRRSRAADPGQAPWEKTGRWEKYRDNMFTTSREKRDYVCKLMSCPATCHCLQAGASRSYRDLLLRYGEFGERHRNEPSGGLHGIMRVRGFTQDDGNFRTEERGAAERAALWTAAAGRTPTSVSTDIIYKVATRPEARIGSDEAWERAEQALMAGLRAGGCEFEITPGEGAFYGPKIEYTLKDAIGRQWQCGTMQIDPNLPERLGAEYVAEDGSRQRPLMLHRAIVGSLERFIGILIEQHAGAMPAWLAPLQVVVAPITENQSDYAASVAKTLQKQGVRVQSDLRNEKITRKIREHSMQKVPYILVVGDKEKANGAVSVRARGNQDLGFMSLDDFAAKLADDIYRKV